MISMNAASYEGAPARSTRDIQHLGAAGIHNNEAAALPRRRSLVKRKMFAELWYSAAHGV